MFLINALGFSGTRWMVHVLTECGIPCGHEGVQRGKIPDVETFGAVGHLRYFTEYDDFNPIVHQVRNPLDYANAHIIHWGQRKKENESCLRIGKVYREEIIENFPHDFSVEAPVRLRDRIQILIIWDNVNALVDSNKKVSFRYCIENMKLLGAPFARLIEELGFDPNLHSPSFDGIWDDRFTHNPQLPPLEEREKLRWPDLSQWPEMQFRLDQIKERAVRYGYQA